MKDVVTGSNQKMFKLKFDLEAAKFIFFFIISLSVFYFLSIRFEEFIPFFNMQSTAQVLFFFLKSVGINATIESYQIIFSNFSIEIVRQCTGIFEVIAIASCILAFPSSIKKKIIGISLALPIIYFFNMGRLIFLSVLGMNYPSVFEAVHDYLLQITFVFLVIFFWIFWVNKVVKSGKA
jgi:archaeosortase B (VPXXXP-CTERM-specific)